MEKKQNVPALRFQGFSGEWEKYNLSMLSGVITKGTTPLDKSGKGDVNFIKIENIDANTGAIHVTQKISQEEHNGYLKRSQLKENDILFSIAGTLGRVAVVKANLLPANTNQALAIIRLKKGNFQYVKTYLQGKAVENFLKANPTVGAQPNLSLAQVGDLEVVMPEESKEQENISDFFQYWDELIFHTMAKIKRLRQFRQAMLAKLFPREGAAEPALRFQGFFGPWRHTQISDIADVIGGGTPDTQIEEYWNGDIDWYTPAEMEGKRYANGSDRKITELGLAKSGARLLPAHRTVLFTSRAGIGKMAILGKDGATNQGFQSLVLNDYCDPYFIYTLGPFITKCAERIAAGSTFLEISGKALGALEIMIPTKAEQEKIAKFFEKLDDIISLQQEMLDKIQKLKAALLEKLFV